MERAQLLRIGVLQKDGRLFETRVEPGRTVQVGPIGSGSTVELSAACVAEPVDLFAYEGAVCRLRLPAGVGGQIQTSPLLHAPSRAFGALFSELEGGADASEGLRLEPAWRGRLDFGDVAILFQFVDDDRPEPPPPSPPRVPGLSWRGLDAQYAALLLVCTMAASLVINRASHYVYVEPSSIEQISERYQQLIMPDRLVVAPPEATPEATPEPEAEVKAEPAKTEKNVAQLDPQRKKEVLRKAVQKKGLLRVIGTRGAGSGALAAVFSDSTGTIGTLDQAFSDFGGVEVAELGGGRGATRGGQDAGALDIGALKTGGAKAVQGTAKREIKVKGTVDASPASIEGSLSASAVNRAMRKYMSAIRHCYERALKRSPDLRGKLVVALEIEARGRVAEVEFPKDTVGSAEVRGCIERRARSWRFPKPEGGAGLCRIPTRF